MQALIDRIRQDAVYLGKGIVKVDGFINHQIDPVLTAGMGEAFAARFAACGATRVITAEVSGIPPALATAMALNVPLIYARKQRPATLTEPCYTAPTTSRTKGNTVDLQVSSRYLHADDKVLIIDDFLATGTTLNAMVSIIAQSGATLVGIGCVVEKMWEGGRETLRDVQVPIESLAKLHLVDERIVVED